MNLDQKLRLEYQALYETMVPRWADGKREALEPLYEGMSAECRAVIRFVNENKARYEKISKMAGGAIPWQFIAVIHNLECGLSFNKHLHNGDPLTARTKLVPAGRPKSGKPPFSFEESAVDALTMPGKEFHKETDWSIPAMLFKLEGFNGFGYRKFHPKVKSPYLWSGSNHYTQGKYVADGKWSATAISRQLGAALVLKYLYNSK